MWCHMKNSLLQCNAIASSKPLSENCYFYQTIQRNSVSSSKHHEIRLYVITTVPGDCVDELFPNKAFYTVSLILLDTQITPFLFRVRVIKPLLKSNSPYRMICVEIRAIAQNTIRKFINIRYFRWEPRYRIYNSLIYILLPYHHFHISSIRILR